MSCCPENNCEVSNTKQECPGCGHIGHGVQLKTVKSLLNKSLFEIKGKDYNFCSTSTCDVVYYEVNVGQIFTETDIDEKVYPKHLNDENVKVCNCFNYTLQDIRQDVDETGNSKIFEKITQGTKLGICACDLRNPEGKCCLPNIKNLLQNNRK